MSFQDEVELSELKVWMGCGDRYSFVLVCEGARDTRWYGLRPCVDVVDSGRVSWLSSR